MSDTYSVIYSPEARNDIKEIYSYIAFELLVPGTAEGQVNKIRKTIRSLDFMPSRNPIVEWEPWKSMGMHKALVDNFVVFYMVDTVAFTVTIIRIVYGGQDIQIVVSQIYIMTKCRRDSLMLFLFALKTNQNPSA